MRYFFKPAAKSSSGFTLMELMIAVVIVAILASIALPSYRQYIIRSKRSAAEAQMMDIADREQQYLIANRSYADKTTLEASGYALPSDLSSDYSYDIALGTGTNPTFTITFTAIGSQANDGNLTLDNVGTKSPSSKW